MPEPGFLDELVDFETPDGQVLKMRRAEAEQFAQEGAGKIAGEVPTAMEAQGPTGAAAFEVPSLQEVQLANTPAGLEPTPGPLGPAGLELNLPSAPQGNVPFTPFPSQETAASDEELAAFIAERDGSVPASIFPNSPDAVATPPEPVAAPATPVARPTPRAPRVRRSASPATVSQASERGKTLTSDFEKAEEQVVRRQQAAQMLRSQGFDSEADTILQSVADTEQSIRDRQEALEQDERENRIEAAERAERLANLETEIADTEIGDKRSLGTRLLGGLMIGLFQAGSTLAGRPGAPNLAMQIIEGAVKRDIESQKAELGKLTKAAASEKNELGRLRDEMGSLEAAEDKLTEIRLGQAQKKLAALESQTQSALHKNNAATLDSKLDEARAGRRVQAETKRLEAEAKLAKERRSRAFQRQQKREDRAFELKKFGVKAALDQANKQAEQAAKQGDKFSKDVSDIGKEFVKSGAGEMTEALNQAQDVMVKHGVNPNNFLGAVGSRIPGVRRWVAEDTKRAAQAQSQVKLIMQRLLTGKAGSDSERAEIGRLMGVNWDSSPEAWVNAMNLVHKMTRRKQNEVRGQNPQAFDQFMRNVQEGQAQPVNPRFGNAGTFQKR